MAKSIAMRPMKWFKTAPLEGVIGKQKEYMDALKSVIPHIENASKALLRWSYAETNPCIAHAFSCWADLDYAYSQLLLQLCTKGVTYRKAFKDIRDRGMQVNRVEEDKKRCADKVAQHQNKVERLKKLKKVDPPKIDSAEAELLTAKSKYDEAAQLLIEKTKEFEEFKAKTIRDSMMSYSSDYLEVLANIQMIFETKKKLGELMSETPVYTAQDFPNGHNKVDSALQKLNLELPMRDTALDRHQINRTVSVPAMKMGTSPVLQPKLTSFMEKHFPVKLAARGVKRIKRLKKTKDSGVRLLKYRKTSLVEDDDVSDGEDNHDYQYPEEPIGCMSTDSLSTASTRNSTCTGKSLADEEEYIVPNELSTSQTLPASQKLENTEHMDTVYFEVEEKSPVECRIPPGKSTEDLCADDSHPSAPGEVLNKSDEYYGNITIDELNKRDAGGNRNNSQASQISRVSQISQVSNKDRPRKPSPLPKPTKGKANSPRQGESPLISHNASVESVQDESSEVYVLQRIPDSPKDENFNSDYDTVCVKQDDNIYGNVEFHEMNQQTQLQQPSTTELSCDVSTKGPLPTPRNKKTPITHTYFNPEMKDEAKARHPPRSPLPPRPK